VNALAKMLEVETGERRPLEAVLADWREEARILRKRGVARIGRVIEQLCDDVAGAIGIEEHLRWISEEDAMLRSGRSRTWLRAQFPEWERLHHAKRDGKRRLYRMLVIPVRANLTAAAVAGRAAAHT
jgi:hypothetical protein